MKQNTKKKLNYIGRMVATRAKTRRERYDDKYVFDDQSKSFIGEFDQMYKAEKTENFDSWNQDDVNTLDNQLFN